MSQAGIEAAERLVKHSPVKALAKMTPMAAARAVMAVDEIDEASVVTIGYAPAGRGGWKITVRENRIFIVGSKAVIVREKAHAWNGLCHMCGAIYLESVLDRYGAKDPQAGQKVGNYEAEDSDRWHIYFRPGEIPDVVYGDYAKVVACPACAASPDLLTLSQFDWLGGFDFISRRLTVVRDHPTLNKYSMAINSIRIDIREWQSARSDLIHISHAFRDDLRTINYSIHVNRRKP
jgi:hypothetical protein